MESPIPEQFMLKFLGIHLSVFLIEGLSLIFGVRYDAGINLIEKLQLFISLDS